MFLEFEAADCSGGGVREFRALIKPEEIRQKMLEKNTDFWAALAALVGALGARPPCHFRGAERRNKACKIAEITPPSPALLLKKWFKTRRVRGRWKGNHMAVLHRAFF